jgi:hypothetical protein
MGVRVQQQAASQSGAVRVSLALAGAGPRISASPARGCLALHCMLCYRHEHAVLALVDLITLRPCPPTSENGRLYTCAIAITCVRVRPLESCMADSGSDERGKDRRTPTAHIYHITCQGFHRPGRHETALPFCAPSKVRCPVGLERRGRREC